MTEREKVIKGLEQFITDFKPFCGNEADWKRVFDAHALLNEQEPQGTPEAEWLLYKGMRGATCSYCKHTFNDVYDAENYDYYCRHCGAKMIKIRTVKWE
jgi:hypothetical protein